MEFTPAEPLPALTEGDRDRRKWSKLTRGDKRVICNVNSHYCLGQGKMGHEDDGGIHSGVKARVSSQLLGRGSLRDWAVGLLYREKGRVLQAAGFKIHNCHSSGPRARTLS